MLKVGSPQQPMNDMPPMDDPMTGGMPPMDGGMEDPMMGNDMGGAGMPNDGMGDMPPESDFDTNFDAGVDADEESDPKKFIQQLTGKLSQALRKYKQENPQDASDISKYVGGMTISAAIDGLSEEDADEMLKKIQGDENAEMPDNGQPPMDDEMGNEMPMDDGGDNQMPPQQDMMPTESINRKERLNELFQELTSKEEKIPFETGKPKKNYNQKPYVSPFM